MEPELDLEFWRIKIRFINQEYHRTFLTRDRPENPDYRPPMAVRKTYGKGVINFRKPSTECRTVEKIHPRIVGFNYLDKRPIFDGCNSYQPQIYLPNNYFYSCTPTQLLQLSNPKFLHQQATKVLLNEMKAGELVLYRTHPSEHSPNHGHAQLHWTPRDSLLFQLNHTEIKPSRIPVNYRFEYSLTPQHWSEIQRLGKICHIAPPDKVLEMIDF